MKLPPPYTQTLFVELIRFTPGVPENSGGRRSPPLPGQPMEELPSRGMPLTNGNASQAPPHPRVPHHHMPHAAHHPHRSAPIPPPNPYENGKPIGIADPSSNRHVPPPPPWSTQMWSNAAVTAPPPGARPHPDARSPHIPSPHPSTSSSPQSSASRKRKYPEDVPSHPQDERMGSSFSPGPPKRRQASDTPQPAATTPRSTQGLSPSLAMLVSPGPNDIRSPSQTRPPPPPPPYVGRPIAPGAMPPSANGRIVDDRPPRAHPHASPHAPPHTSPHVAHAPTHQSPHALPQTSRKLVYTDMHPDQAREYVHGGQRSPPDDYRAVPPPPQSSMHPRR